jgi:hypothetical protein
MRACGNAEHLTPVGEKETIMRSVVVHFTGGTEVTIATEAEPAAVFEALQGEGKWLVIEDTSGESHYLSTPAVAYLTFGHKKGIGFSS